MNIFQTFVYHRSLNFMAYFALVSLWQWSTVHAQTVNQSDSVKVNEIQDSLILREISLDEAYELYMTKTGLFVDSRSLFFYKRAHIRDAISICYRCTDTSSAMKAMPKNRLLVVYCGGPRCDQAQMLIRILLEQNFKNIYLFSGGMDAWREAGYPIDEIDITKKTHDP